MGGSSNVKADVAFVSLALLIGVIDIPDVRAWADQAIAQLDEPPLWLFDLSYFDDEACHLDRTIGFWPSDESIDDDALAGIAIRRGRSIDVTVRSPAAALQALARNPAMEDRFRSTFPFLNY